jgi:hypothetical protein
MTVPAAEHRLTPYTHWWACHPTGPAYAAAWPSILDATIRIFGLAAGHHITVRGPGGYGPPIISRRKGIHLGGNAAEGLHGRPLRLPAPLRHPNPGSGARTARGSVDTGRLAYDTVVTAVLVRCHHLIGDRFSIRCDGNGDTEWQHGAVDGIPAARQLPATCFGHRRRHRR